MVSGGFLYDRQLRDHLERRGDTVEVLSLPWAGYGAGLLHNLSAALLTRLLRADFHVLLQDELAHPGLFLLNARLRARAPYPVISIVHHLRCCEMRPPWQNSLYRRVERRYLDSVDGFIFNSRTTKAVVEALIAGAKRHVVALPSASHMDAGVTEEEIAGRARQEGPLEILFVGSVIPRKQLHVLLDALEHVTGGSAPHGGRQPVHGRPVCGLDREARSALKARLQGNPAGLRGGRGASLDHKAEPPPRRALHV